MMRGGSGTEMEMGMVRKGKMDEVGEQLASIEGTCALVCVCGGGRRFLLAAFWASLCSPPWGSGVCICAIQASQLVAS